MLDELLEEYKETGDRVLIDEFMKMLWGSKYKFKKYSKTYTFDVDEGKLNGDSELIELFKCHQETEFRFCKSFYKSKLDYIDYIRIHVNNMYGYLVDRELYLPKEYYHLLLSPKREYYNTVDAIREGLNVDPNSIDLKIKESLDRAEEIRNEALKKKIELSWAEYKKLIRNYVERLFKNYKPPHEYEEEHGWQMSVYVDGWSENNYVVKYFCRSLTGYMRNYVKSLQPKKQKKKFCFYCGVEIFAKSNRKKYCGDCLIEKERARKRKVWHSIKNKISKN
ncbi:hypothetical protein FZC83_02290 [Rossellomorea marisflavi]|uniref:Uncharacterized protein n=1 Tax=Rossellomorea marisflavi TaxID=189381 RepID=A0A5D4S3U2_9BACI|nr:hypothetical protein [Rossellomorea marisflavi]TYS56426.1 hypothetical protein FZC83_02290 [Rossellomorea marisflavi]